MTDAGSEANKFPRQWAVLMNKGYQGAGEYVRAITPTKKHMEKT